jgi:AraC-like DNA-binding protein
MATNESGGRIKPGLVPASAPPAPACGAVSQAAWAVVLAAFEQYRAPSSFFEARSADGASEAPADPALPAAVLQHIRRTALDRNVFLELGRIVSDGQAGLLGPLLVAQPNGSAAVEQFQRYQELLGGPPWTVDTQGGLVRFGYRPGSTGEDAELAAELALSTAYHAALRFWGSAVAPVIGVELAFAEPAAARDFRRYFAGPIRFGTSRCSIVVPQALFELTRPGVDHGLAKHLRDYAFTHWASRGGMRSWVARVEAALAPAQHLHEYQLERVARSLQVSERTLRRRLAEESTTFSAVSARMRDERAARFLLETDLSLAQIANTLGYSDPTSFRRACRNRFGRTPRQIRRSGFAQPGLRERGTDESQQGTRG